jgi:hypothetical protein
VLFSVVVDLAFSAIVAGIPSVAFAINGAIFIVQSNESGSSSMHATRGFCTLQDPSEQSGPAWAFIFITIEAVIYIVIIFLLSILLRKVKDSLYMKAEYITIGENVQSARTRARGAHVLTY